MKAQKLKKPVVKDEDKGSLEKAKELFFQYTPISEIAEFVGIPRTTVSYHANKHWKLERELLAAELFETLSDSKRSDFVRITKDAIKVMQRSLSYLANRSEPPTVQEARMASSMLADLAKLSTSKSKEEEMLEQFSNQENLLNEERSTQIKELNPFHKEN